MVGFGVYVARMRAELAHVREQQRELAVLREEIVAHGRDRGERRRQLRGMDESRMGRALFGEGNSYMKEVAELMLETEFKVAEDMIDADFAEYYIKWRMDMPKFAYELASDPDQEKAAPA